VQVPQVVRSCVGWLLVGPAELGYHRRDGIGVDRLAGELEGPDDMMAIGSVAQAERDMDPIPGRWPALI
jgi:hypothetical protein